MNSDNPTDEAERLQAALDDPDPNIRRTAVVSLGETGELPALPGLIREFTRPNSHCFRTELKLAIQSILIRAESRTPAKPPSELQDWIAERVRALEANRLGQWPIRVARDEHQALPLHGNSAFLWCLSPAGAILRIDHDDLRHSADEETDSLVRFAVAMQGAAEYPELWPLVPPAPKNTRPCLECSAHGYAEGTSCLSCGGLGWHLNHRWLSR